MPYVTYIVECKDKSLYCGIATDIKRRIAEHNTSSRGARYTRARRPVVVRYLEYLPTRSKALRREAAIKRLTRAEKIALIATAGSVRMRKKSHV